MLIGSVLLLLLISVPAAGQNASGEREVGETATSPSEEKRTLTLSKAQGTIELDGRIEELAWQKARRLPAVQHAPNFDKEPTEETEILVTYDEDYLYAACRCRDKGAMSTPSFKRDFFRPETDFFMILLDTFNDNENALMFLTTPTGLRTDVAISNDAEESPFDPSWNTFWDVEVHQNEEGWTAEMRIPVSSLRFQSEGGTVTMGLTAARHIARKGEVDVFPDIPPNWGFLSFFKPSQAQEVEFNDLEPETPFQVSPYLLGGFGQQSVLNDAGTAYGKQTDPTYDAGLDIKYGLSSNLTLDLTVNTDFAQVEADDQQVNLTRFPLFFPEKRKFFKERSSNFAFDFGGPNRLFYSRRIGLTRGEQVRILGGARLVGREGPWDIGVLNMQTARQSGLGPHGESVPSENFGVARLRRQVLNENSYVGGILTSRLGMKGSYNVAYGLDGIFRVTGQQYLRVKWAQTFDDGSAGAEDQKSDLASLDHARMQVHWEDRSYEGIRYDLRYDRAGTSYEPGIGFERREDYFRLGDQVGYGWIPGEESRLQRHRLSLVGEAYFRNLDRSLQSLEIGPEWGMQTNENRGLTLSAKHRVEDLVRPFPLADKVQVPAGRYTFHLGEVSYRMPPGQTFQARANLEAGSFYDGWRSTMGVRPTINVSRYLRIRGFYQINRIRFPDRGQDLTAHVGRFRLEVTPNVRYSVSSFLQYNSANDVVVGNLRFRYNPGEGNDLYLVYNEHLNTDRSPAQGSTERGIAGPRLPLSSQRTVMLKYTYTFNW